LLTFIFKASLCSLNLKELIGPKNNDVLVFRFCAAQNTQIQDGDHNPIIILSGGIATTENRVWGFVFSEENIEVCLNNQSIFSAPTKVSPSEITKATLVYPNYYSHDCITNNAKLETISIEQAYLEMIKADTSSSASSLMSTPPASAQGLVIYYVVVVCIALAIVGGGVGIGFLVKKLTQKKQQ
jgi:hypothetical protein